MYCCFYFKYSSKVYQSKPNDIDLRLFSILQTRIYKERSTVAIQHGPHSLVNPYQLLKSLTLVILMFTLNDIYCIE